MDDYPTDNDEVLNGQHRVVIDFLTNSQEMRQTAKSSLKQSMYAGGGALAGGFILGPVGGLVGGIAGSVAGFLHADDYDGAVLAMSKLEGARKDALLKGVGAVLMAAGATARQFESAEAFQSALKEFAAQPAVRQQIWNACRNAVNP